MLALARGEEELLTSEEVMALIEAATPLAFWRRKRGMAQADLAEKIGISQSALAEIESGARIGRPHMLKTLADALGVRVSDLIAAKS